MGGNSIYFSIVPKINQKKLKSYLKCLPWMFFLNKNLELKKKPFPKVYTGTGSCWWFYFILE